MDLWRLHIFCKVVEEKSFTKASESVRLSQPTVSAHIRYLEEYFGSPLIDYTNKKALPTKAGEVLYSYSLKLLALKEETESAVAKFKGAEHGHIMIGGSTIPSSYILPQLIGAFKVICPGAKITLVQDDTDKIIKGVAEGLIEIGLVGARLPDKRITFTPFEEDELVLVTPLSHHLAKRKYISIGELKIAPLIIRERGSGTRRILEEALKQAGCLLEDFNVVAEMGSSESARQGIKAGVGVSILSKKVVSDDAEKSFFSTIRIKELSLKRSFYLILNKQRAQSPLCKAFVSFITTSGNKRAASPAKAARCVRPNG
ncbi:MAG: selenium metabolism-associated LysR family transcriptional regulator [Pseudomonadota bacterium]